MVRLNARLDMTIAVDWDVKPQTKSNKSILINDHIKLNVTKCSFRYLFWIKNVYFSG